MTFNQFFSGAAVATLLGLATLGTTSCSKDFIDLNDPTRLPTTLGYTDSLSIVTGVTAAYASLQDIYGSAPGNNRGMFVFTEIPSDNSFALTSGELLNEFNDFSISTINPRLQSQWQVTYRAIARCNIILSRAGGVKLTDATRNRFFGEVRFIRALAYFNAVQIWGDIPLVKDEIASIADAYKFGREKKENVYALIEEDLTFAENNLPTAQAGANLGRATKGAAQGLLGKVLLTEKKYAAAALELKKVIDANNYALQATYANIFLTSNEMNTEILAAARYTKGGLGIGSAFNTWFMPVLPAAVATTINGNIGTGQQFNSVDPDLVAAFTASGATDVRAAASFGTYVSGTTTLYYTKKYIDLPTSSTDAENDWIILRYADVLLMYAEAVNETGGTITSAALDAVNRVIRRSRNLPVATPNATVDLPATISQADLRARLALERRLELNFEGHRWFDLVRTDQAIPVMNAFFTRTGSVSRIDSHNLVWPIPQQERQTNPVLTQNDGYPSAL
ncbi:RagB/SusD family nutrient uptake outer membrane protein [Hymenobacter negativus]|uniref:RagB/SusD family nutrient uptake outer membrane protein n=1 Tax=Hymenobacter negativus TaxID=2795026 RepID=A0ABS0QDB3_9BACT|nr:RagB/SusD family nutrient uptake outer membrane protein [Hymenobacter negativus]MBH8560186.1 RagB/SusD family nutrient uptake outer membrane protein [Hymenobacter negativus]